MNEDRMPDGVLHYMQSWINLALAARGDGLDSALARATMQVLLDALVAERQYVRDIEQESHELA
jgi:hypothetical protein